MPLPKNLPYREYVFEETPAATGKGKKKQTHTRIINRRNRKRRADGEIVFHGEAKTRFDLGTIDNLIVSLMAGDYQIVTASGKVIDGAERIVELQKQANLRRHDVVVRVRKEIGQDEAKA